MKILPTTKKKQANHLDLPVINKHLFSTLALSIQPSDRAKTPDNVAGNDCTAASGRIPA
jgi:hypothetical protein